MVHRGLNFDDSYAPTVDPENDVKEEDFPTGPWITQYGPMNLHWKWICKYTWFQENQTSYPSQIPTQLQGPVYESATLEKPIDSVISDMLNLINDPKEVLFQNYLYAPWM